MTCKLNDWETFENVEKFYEFLKENLKLDYYIERVYLEDLLDRISATGSKDYELSPFETKSGHPELICFDVDYTYVDENGVEIEDWDDYDSILTTITF